MNEADRLAQVLAQIAAYCKIEAEQTRSEHEFINGRASMARSILGIIERNK